MINFAEAVAGGIHDPDKMQAFMEVFDDCSKNFRAASPMIFSNEVGIRLLDRDVFDVAEECFELSFRLEDPYSLNRTTYAGNMVESLAKAWMGLDATPELRPWILNKRPALTRAIDCLAHFKRVTMLEEGYITPLRNAGMVIWATHERWDQYRKLDSRQTNGTNLLGHLNLLPSVAP